MNKKILHRRVPIGYQLDKMFEDVMSSIGGGRSVFDAFDDIFRDTRKLSLYPSRPPINHDILEDGTEVIVIACSGFDKDEISIEVKDKQLIISGTHVNKEEQKEKVQKRNLVTKFTTDDFSLTFIPSSFSDLSKIEASFEKCILTVKIPHKDAPKSEVKKIDIK